MGNQTMSLGKLSTQIGALFAYLVGSGFATGQETVQFFSVWGSIWDSLLVGAISFFMMYLTYSAYAYAGRTRHLCDLKSISRFYTGSLIGKLFELFAWIFNACAYVFMVSGFGSVLLQQWGIPLFIGSAIAVVLSVITAIAGLNNLIKIISKLGPLLIVLTLCIGVISASEFYPLINQGNRAVINGDVSVVRAGTNAISAGLSYGGACVLLVSAMVGRMGSQLRSYRFYYTKMTIAVVALGLPIINIIMGLNHIGNIEQASHAQIPNLLLANHIFGAIGDFYAIIILVAIYSTLCPIIWTCVSMHIPNEKCTRYKLTCIFSGIGVYFITLFIPYQTLLHYVMTYCGSAGALVCIVIVSRYLIVKAKDNNGHSHSL